jgi:hypothetical protein
MSDWVGVAALIVAVIAVPITVWATRQWGNRRAKIEFYVDSVSLMPANARAGLLEITYRDIPVQDPHLVTIGLRNTGPRDVTAAMFHDGEAISLTFNQTFYGLTQVKGNVKAHSRAIGTPAAESAINLQPALLKRGDEWSVSAVLSGPVEVKVDAPLVDTDVKQVERSEEDRMRRLAAILVPILIAKLR